MNKAQHIVLILYCLLLAYCCIWIPWHIAEDQDYLRVGYGWLWAGSSKGGPLTAPDLPLIFLRILAVTSVSAAAYFAAMRR